MGILLKYQLDWIGDNSDVRVIEKSRRIGISWAEAADSVLCAASENGSDVWYIGYSKEMAKEFIRDCAEWARFYDLAAHEMGEIVLEDEDKDIITYQVMLKYRITALSSRPKNLRGKQGRVIIDEAAFHENVDELIKAAIALLMWGSKIRIISTHNGEDNKFNELVNDIRAGKYPYSLHRVDLDDALKGGLYVQICRRLGREYSKNAETEWRENLIRMFGSHAQEELFCIPSKGNEVYLSRALIESRMDDEIPMFRWKCPSKFEEISEGIRRAEALDWCRENLDPALNRLEKLPSYFGEDFGRTGDLTVIAPLMQQQDLVMRCPFVVELRNVPFKQQEQILFYILDRLPMFRGGAMDARGNGQYLAEVAMQRYGSSRIGQVMLSRGWYMENMPRFKAAFEDRTIKIPKDSYILDDLRLLTMQNGAASIPDDKRTKEADGSERHGDFAIAAAMGVCAARTFKGDEFRVVSAMTRAARGMFEGYGAFSLAGYN